MAYYDAYTMIEENKNYSGKIDVTPFVLYFIENVYNKINEDNTDLKTLHEYETIFKSGKITAKEDACKIEHDISDYTFEKLKSFIETKNEA